MIKKISDFYILFTGINGHKTWGCNFTGDSLSESGHKKVWAENVDTLQRYDDKYLTSLGLSIQDISFVRTGVKNENDCDKEL